MHKLQDAPGLASGVTRASLRSDGLVTNATIR